MTPLFPAILIGGPPHAGKSTLTYRLSRALRLRAVPHYALRASPDGEGDWFVEAPEALVYAVRARSKSTWSPNLADRLSRDVANRHLPLLVDAGGKVSPETAQIAAHCTHAILIAADPADLAPWRDLVARHGLLQIAEVQSVLSGPQVIDADGPILRGRISGLARAADSAGVCFDALVARVARVCATDAEAVYRAHVALTDLELVIHVKRAIHPLPPHTTNNPWQPAELPTLLDSLPSDEPLGIYGRGPVWLYAALAAFSAPEPQVFDVRHGWVTPPTPVVADQADPARLRWDAVTVHPDYAHVQLSIPDGYLDEREAGGVPVPRVAAEQGVVLDGRLPNWLWAALARSYAHAAWVAVYQPQHQQAVVVCSRDDGAPVGSTRALAE